MAHWTTLPAKKHVTVDFSTLWFFFIRIVRKSKRASAAHQSSWYQGGEKRSFCHASDDTINSENLSSKGNWPSVNTKNLWKSTFNWLHLKDFAPAIHWMLCLQVDPRKHGRSSMFYCLYFRPDFRPAPPAQTGIIPFDLCYFYFFGGINFDVATSATFSHHPIL